MVGPYTTSWNGAACGIMEGDQGVPTIEHSNQAQLVDNTDKYGRIPIDGVYLGGSAFAQFTCMEYRSGSIGAFWPWGTLGQWGQIGRLLYTLSQSLVLTAVGGTTATPSTLTASRSILAPGFNSRLLHGPMVKKVPIRLILFPSDTSGTVFSTS